MADASDCRRRLLVDWVYDTLVATCDPKFPERTSNLRTAPRSYLFWLKFPLQIGRIVLCTAIGSVMALAAKRVEMVAVMTLALLTMALFGLGTVALIVTGRTWLHWLLVMMPWNCLTSAAILAGGAIVKVRRSAVARRSALS